MFVECNSLFQKFLEMIKFGYHQYMQVKQTEARIIIICFPNFFPRPSKDATFEKKNLRHLFVLISMNFVDFTKKMWKEGHFFELAMLMHLLGSFQNSQRVICSAMSKFFVFFTLV